MRSHSSHGWLLTLLLSAAALVPAASHAAERGRYNMNPDAFLQSLPQDEQRALGKNPSFSQTFKSARDAKQSGFDDGSGEGESEASPFLGADDGSGGFAPLPGDEPPNPAETAREKNVRYGALTPAEKFLDQYMQCDYVRSGYNRTDPCTRVRSNYCKFQRSLPAEIRQHVAEDFQCKTRGSKNADPAQTDPTFDDASPAAVAKSCAAHDALTLRLLRKYYGKENETHALLFFASGLIRELNVCAKAKK